jgi:hypothetical protein
MLRNESTADRRHWTPRRLWRRATPWLLSWLRLPALRLPALGLPALCLKRSGNQRRCRENRHCFPFHIYLLAVPFGAETRLSVGVIVPPAPELALLVLTAHLELEVLDLPLGFPSPIRSLFARVPPMGVGVHGVVIARTHTSGDRREGRGENRAEEEFRRAVREEARCHRFNERLAEGHGGGGNPRY